MINEIREILIAKSEADYQKFSASLLPDVSNVLGVRLPVLRKMAKEIVKSDWQKFLKCETIYMEETMLQGMVIGLVAKKTEDFLLISDFIPKINNWSVCDSFCCSLKFVQIYKKEFFEFLDSYLSSAKEYEIRFGLVILINYYVEKDYLKNIFKIADNFSSQYYYAQMAMAWLLSICYVRFPDLTEKYLEKSKLDDYTFNKTIQKIIESNRIEKSEKFRLKKYKR